MTPHVALLLIGLVKQLGARSVVNPPQGESRTPGIRNRKGGDMSEWPEDLRVREFPEVP